MPRRTSNAHPLTNLGLILTWVTWSTWLLASAIIDCTGLARGLGQALGRRHRDDGHNGEACRQNKCFQFHYFLLGGFVIPLEWSLFLFACIGCGAFGLDDLLHGLGVDGAGDEAVADHEARRPVDVE